MSSGHVCVGVWVCVCVHVHESVHLWEKHFDFSTFRVGKCLWSEDMWADSAFFKGPTSGLGFGFVQGYPDSTQCSDKGSPTPEAQSGPWQVSHGPTWSVFTYIRWDSLFWTTLWCITYGLGIYGKLCLYCTSLYHLHQQCYVTTVLQILTGWSGLIFWTVISYIFVLVFFCCFLFVCFLFWATSNLWTSVECH